MPGGVTDPIFVGTPWQRKPGVNDAVFYGWGKGGISAGGNNIRGGGGSEKSTAIESSLADEYNVDFPSGTITRRLRSGAFGAEGSPVECRLSSRVKS